MRKSKEVTRDLSVLGLKVAEAVHVLRNSSSLNDVDLHRALVDKGFGYLLAARIIEFLPSAYAHVFFEKSGVKLAKYYQRRLSDGRSSESRPLADEPVWQAALAFAYTEHTSGRSKEDFLVLAMRSAEFHCINQLLHRGSKLRDIVCTPLLLPWPENGPPQD